MLPKSAASKIPSARGSKGQETKKTAQEPKRKSILVVPSRTSPTTPADIEQCEETEIAVEITVPPDGGWGWVVVLASFSCIFILDGVFFTFGSIFPDMVEDLSVEGTLVGLINSIALAMYFLAGPIVSALINRFGFRACAMMGAIIVAFGYLCAYFTYEYMTLLVFYGVVAGFGACLIAMPSFIIVGFYFERLRAVALAIAGAGSSAGIMVMFSANSFFVTLAGWRITTLLHSALFASVYFIAMAYRPLLSLTVTTDTDTGADPTRTVTYLPNLSSAAVRGGPSRTTNTLAPTKTERLFSAVSNANFPTAASIIQEGVVTQQTTATQAGPSSGTVSRLTLTARTPKGGMSQRQLNQVQSIMSRPNVADKHRKSIEIKMETPTTDKKKERLWARLFHWEGHVEESRPMYRDDAFYTGKVEKLSVYQKSVMDTPQEARTGLEYQMAVSRAATTADLEENRGIYTTAFRRVLASMLDPKLLECCSFLLLCTTGFLSYVGILVPYIFLPDRNKSEGIDVYHCNLFVSFIGLCNIAGRVLAGTIAYKYNPFILYQISFWMTGISIISFNFSFEIYYQYTCCAVFGVFVAVFSCLRGVVLVDLYGLDKLTNATGILLMFQGLGSLVSNPLSLILKNMFGYSVSFYVAGTALLLSGAALLPIPKLRKKELASQAAGKTNVTGKKPANLKI